MRVIRCPECDRLHCNPQEGQTCPYDGGPLVGEVPREEVRARARSPRQENTPQLAFPRLHQLSNEMQRLATQARNLREEARGTRESAQQDRQQRAVDREKRKEGW